MDLYFPLNNKKMSWETTMQQTWDVVEQKSASGRRRTLCQQTLPGWTINISFPMLTRTERDILLGFYAQCKGKFESFFFTDEEQCHVEQQVLNVGTDGTYQLVSNYAGYVEPVERVANLKVFVNGIETTAFTEDNGVLMVDAEGDVTATYDFYWKVCFGNNLSIAQKFADYYSASLTLEVVRE